MNKKYMQNSPINYVHKGYVLYDNNLILEKFLKSLKDIIKIHDVFNIVVENGKTIIKDNEYTFEEIQCLDQVELKDTLSNFKEKPLNQIAEFKLIYFHGSLRGLYYRFNGFLFDNRSVIKVLEGIEKHYFDDKFNQGETSYVKWLEDNPKSFAIASKTGRYLSKTKTLTFDDNLTQRIRHYINDHEMTSFQFLTGVIGIYYKVSKQKDLVFMTEYFDNKTLDLVGDLSPITSYSLKKNPNVLCQEFIKNDWVQLEKYSHIKINMKDDFSSLKGHVRNLYSTDMPFEAEFLIEEKKGTIEIDISFQKYKTKKDEMFLMLNKLRLIVFNILEKETLIKDLSLLTKKEEQVVLKHMHPSVSSDYLSVYEQFRSLLVSSGGHIAITDDKEITFEQLSTLVEKIKKSISKSVLFGQTFDLSLLSSVEKIAAFIAMDSVSCVYSDKYAYQLKRTMLGYKAVKVFEGELMKGQYFIDDVIISKEGYSNYCQFMKDYFKLNNTDVASDKELLKFAIPTLLAGGQIKINASYDQVSIAEIDSKDLKDYKMMKHVITNEKVVNNAFNYKLHYGVSFKKTVPFSFVGPIEDGKIENLKPVKGLGFVILNKGLYLAQTFEKGELYIFGPGVTAEFDYEFLIINGEEIKHVVKSGERGTWFLDESLRL